MPAPGGSPVTSINEPPTDSTAQSRSPAPSPPWASAAVAIPLGGYTNLFWMLASTSAVGAVMARKAVGRGGEEQRRPSEKSRDRSATAG